MDVRFVHNIMEPSKILAQIPFTKTEPDKFYMEYKKFYIQSVSPAAKHTYDLRILAILWNKEILEKYQNSMGHSQKRI